MTILKDDLIESDEYPGGSGVTLSSEFGAFVGDLAVFPATDFDISSSGERVYMLSIIDNDYK